MSTVSGATQTSDRRLESSCSREKVSRNHRRTTATHRRALALRSAAGRITTVDGSTADLLSMEVGMGFSDIVGTSRILDAIGARPAGAVRRLGERGYWPRRRAVR